MITLSLKLLSKVEKAVNTEVLGLISQCTSSLITIKLCFLQISSTFKSYSLLQSLPVGFCGLQNKRTLALGDFALASRSSKSSLNSPS